MLVYLLLYFLNIICVVVGVEHATEHMWGPESNFQESVLFFSVWVLGIELRSSGLVPRALTLYITPVTPNFSFYLLPEQSLSKYLSSGWIFRHGRILFFVCKGKRIKFQINFTLLRVELRWVRRWGRSGKIGEKNHDQNTLYEKTYLKKRKL